MTVKNVMKKVILVFGIFFAGIIIFFAIKLGQVEKRILKDLYSSKILDKKPNGLDESCWNELKQNYLDIKIPKNGIFIVESPDGEVSNFYEIADDKVKRLKRRPQNKPHLIVDVAKRSFYRSDLILAAGWSICYNAFLNKYREDLII